MKLIMFEIYKLFSKKLLLICLVLFFTANSIFLVYTQSNNLEVKTVHTNLSDYENIISKYSDYVPTEAQRQLESELKTVEIALQLDRTADNSNGDDLKNLGRITEQYRAENPEEYKKARALHYTKQELLDKQTYLSNLVNQCKSLVDYSSFIGDMDERAQMQTKFSVFAEEGSFSYNNILKTAEDFKDVNNTNLKIGNNFAVENSTTFVLTDLLVFALVFLMCVYIFTLERDKELYGLIRTAKYGRMPLIISKLFVLIFFTILICAAYYSSNIALCGLYSGFGDMTRNIQSCELFMNCNLNLQIWQYLVLWGLSKIITMCVLALFIALIFVLVKNTGMVFAVTAFWVFIEGVLYLAIGSNSPLNQLKYINFLYFLSGNNIFGNYLNINIFSHTVNITLIYVIAMILIAIASVTVICMSFVKSAQITTNNIFTPILEKFRRRFYKIQGSVSIFKGECFKHYKGSMAIIAIILLVFVAYGNATDDISVVYSSAQESAYSAYIDKLEGELTQEKEDYLRQQQDYFDGLNEELNTISTDMSLSAEEKEIRITAIDSILKTKGAAFEEISNQASYIKEVGERYHITPIFINYIVYKRLAQNPSREWQYFTLLMAVIIFISSDIFAYEHKKHMIDLIRCTKKGKLRLVLSKVMTLSLTTLISYTLIYLPYYINFIKTFGTESLNTPVVFMQDFANIGSTISVNSMIFITAAVHIAEAVSVMTAVAMLSQVLKNNILSMIVGAVIVLFPCLLCMTLTDIRLYTSFQKGSWMWLVPSLIVLCVFLLMICLTIIAFNFSNIEFKAMRRCKNEA